MGNEQLVPHRNALELSNKTSLTASQQTLAVELNLTALNAKVAPEGELVQEFSREFAEENPEILQWAFREHRRRSQFFPTIAEIYGLVTRIRQELWEAAEAERRRCERTELEQARVAGKLLDIAEIRQKCAEIAAAKQMDPPTKPVSKPFTELTFTEERRQELKRQAKHYA